MNIRRIWKGVYQRLFPLKDIRQALGVEPAVSPEMLSRIAFWSRCYRGKADWVDGGRVISLRLEKAITREFANVSLNEMTLHISDERLDKLCKKALAGGLNRNLQRGLATRGLIIKPLRDNTVQFIAANAYIPLSADVNGRYRDIIFPEIKQADGRWYTRFERHTLTNRGLTITNTAYVSAVPNMLGREISLSYVEEWKDYAPAVTFPIDRMIFGQFSVPLDNTIDDDPNGVSIFEDGIELIKKADIQFGRLDYEFQSAERKIHADLSTVKPDGKGNYHLPEVYVDVSGDKEDFYQEFSPALRQEGFIAGLEEIRRGIEFAVGLAYGDLSHPQYVEKTATEVNAAKIRKRNTVDKLQEQLRLCLEDFVFAMAFYNRMTKSGYEFACDFKDSILNDEQSEREEDRKDLANGTLRPEEYRAKYRGETIDEAKANLPASAEVD